MDAKTRYSLARALAAIGFILIVLNAADYLLGWNAIDSSTTIFGLMFVVIGMLFSKQKKK